MKRREERALKAFAQMILCASFLLSICAPSGCATTGAPSAIVFTATSQVSVSTSLTSGPESEPLRLTGSIRRADAQAARIEMMLEPGSVFMINGTRNTLESGSGELSFNAAAEPALWQALQVGSRVSLTCVPDESGTALRVIGLERPGVVLAFDVNAAAEEQQPQHTEQTDDSATEQRRVGYFAIGAGPSYRWENVEGEVLGETVRARVPSIGFSLDLVVEAPAFTSWLLIGGGLIWLYPGENESDISDPAYSLAVRSVTGLDLGPGALWRPSDWFALTVSPHAFLGWEERDICEGSGTGPIITCEGTHGTGVGVGGMLRVGAFVLIPLGEAVALPVGVLARVVVATKPEHANLPLSHAAVMAAVGIGVR